MLIGVEKGKGALHDQPETKWPMIDAAVRPGVNLKGPRAEFLDPKGRKDNG